MPFTLPPWMLTSEFILGLTFGLTLLFVLIFWLRSNALNNQHAYAIAQQKSEFEQQIAQLHHQTSLIEQQLQQSNTQLDETKQQLVIERQASNEALNTSRTTISEQLSQIARLQQQSEQLKELRLEYNTLNNHYQSCTGELAQFKSELKSQKASFEQERISFEDKITLLKDAEKQLQVQFENLANKIFEEKSEKFSQANATGINQLISPLKQQLDDFKKQINHQYVTEGQERAALKNEITSLKQLNLQITQEAAALTNALKGDNKQQGNWGEVVLARILDESGLREGHEYEVQKQLNNESGKIYRPDVVVHLPNNKDVIIDSKVSLIAHEKLVNASTEELRQKALKEHIASVKGHIKGLSKKDYQDLSGVNTLDYVLLFLPIESAFANVVQAEPEIMKLAMDNQIMLVSPTNLLVALRTINNLWQYEYQNQNANKIADRARKMYEKFAGFVDDLQKIGKQINSLETSYQSAMNKLSSGRGNLLSQVESFKELGITPNKSIDNQGLEQLTKNKE